MVQMLASRAAGFNLAKVIAFLLAPIVYFGFVIVSDLMRERKQLDANASGLQLLDLVYPVILDGVDGWSASDKQARLLDEGVLLAEKAGVAEEFSKLQLVASRGPADSNAMLASGLALAGAVGAANNGSADGDREYNHLAAAGTAAFPKLISDFNALYRQTSSAANNPQMVAMNAGSLLLTAGRLDQSARNFVDTISSARKSSLEVDPYTALTPVASRLVFDAQHLKSVLLDHGKDDSQRLRVLSSELNPMSHKFVTDASSAWKSVSARLASMQFDRSAALWARILRTLVISITAILLGLGSAVIMFRSTLRKLDEVEQARKDATLAREDAERSAGELSGLNDEMVRINAELSDNFKMLKNAQDQLVKKGRMEQMGQLTATIAHELRNPLGAVRTSAFLLERKTRDKGLAIDGQLQRINNGIQRCDDIITQLLDFSRSKQVATSPADLDQWLENLIGEEAQKLPAAVSVSCILGLDGRQVPFDPSRLQRAISNLVLNASEAMVGNGDQPSKQAIANPELTIATKLDGDHAVITVSDNGPGISPENLARIREPLFTTKSFGTGLGLPAVDQIVLQHGGTLKVVSELGKGASFTIRLPLSVQEEIAA